MQYKEVLYPYIQDRYIDQIRTSEKTVSLILVESTIYNKTYRILYLFMTVTIPPRWIVRTNARGLGGEV